MLGKFEGTPVARISVAVRLRFFISFLTLLGICWTTPAWAAGKAFASGGVSVERARIAETLGPDWSTRWLSLRATGKGRIVFVTPVVPGTRADAVGNEWLLGLEGATAPRVRAPKAAPTCGKDVSGVENTSDLSDATIAPSEVGILDDPNAVGTFVKDHGLGFDPEDADNLAPYGPFLAVVYNVTTSGWTEALRLAMPTAAPPVELGWLGSGVEVTLLTLAQGRAHSSNAEEITSKDLGVTFQLSDNKSDYVARRRSKLVAGEGQLFLPEASGTTPLLGWSILPNQSGAIEPAVKSYLGRVAPSSVDACFGSVLDAQASPSHVGRACAPGALLVVPGSSDCDETIGAGKIAASTLRCDGADDLALAFSGFQVGLLRVTRQYTVTGPSSPSPLVLSIEASFDQSPLISAAAFDDKGCVLGNGAGGGGNGVPGWSGDGSQPGTSPYEPGPFEGEQPAPDVHVEVDCWGNTQTGSNNDSCSGNSSDSSGNGDTCGGDSSSSSSDGDTCSGDSSDSSGGDTCSGDSSSGDGNTCSGDSSSSSGGDSCSGDSGGDSCSSGSSGGDGCSVGRHRRVRMRVSALTLLLLAGLLPLRRVTGRKRSRDRRGKRGRVG